MVRPENHSVKKMVEMNPDLNRFGPEEEKLVLMALRSENLSPYFANPAGGPFVQRLEKEFADYIGVDHAVAVSNGSTALHTAYTALGLESWDKIAVPAHTFIATASMVVAAHAWPVWVDIDRHTYGMTFESFEHLSRNHLYDLKAVAPVDLLGTPCSDLEEIYDYARRKRIFVVEDAAQAPGSERRKGKKAGSCFNDCATWSLQQSKTLTAGEGGFITTNDRSFAKKCKAIRSHGSYYEDYEGISFNFRMNELNAAVGLAQLRKYPKVLEQQRRNAEYVISHLPKLIQEPLVEKGMKPNWYIIGCKVNPAEFDRKRFVKALQKRKVSLGQPGKVVGLGYAKPLYDKPLFRMYRPHRDWEQCPAAEALSKRWLWFDVHRFCSLEEVTERMRIINEVASQL